MRPNSNAQRYDSPATGPAVSLVVPARNEAGNILVLAAEVEQALAGRCEFELIFVNDGSTDMTAVEIGAVSRRRPWVREIRHANSCGKAAALRTGVRAARAPVIVALDGDCQNDPAYLPAMLAELEAGGPRRGLVSGQRIGRKDTGFKKLQSRIANRVRRAILRDGTRDAGCGMQAIRREVFLSLPYFDGLHRFLPVLVRREGFDVGYVDVVDRPRLAGTTKYGLWDRLWVGLYDLVGVAWLVRRSTQIPEFAEVPPDAG
jgi:dolichol-phosphate mannosyltransferase